MLTTTVRRRWDTKAHETYVTILSFTKAFKVERDIIDEESGALYANGPETHGKAVNIVNSFMWRDNL